MYLRSQALAVLVFTFFIATAMPMLVHAAQYDIQAIIKYQGSSSVQQGGTIYWNANYTASGAYYIRITQVNASFDGGAQLVFAISGLPDVIPVGQQASLTLFLHTETFSIGTHTVTFSTGWDAYVNNQWVIQSPLVDNLVPSFEIVAQVVVNAPTVHIDYSAGSTVEQGKQLNFTATYQSASSNTVPIRILYTNATVDGVQLMFSGIVWPLVLQPGDSKKVTLFFTVDSSSYRTGSHTVSFTTKWQSNENNQWTDHDPVTSSNVAPFQVISTPNPPGGNGKGNGGSGIDPIYFVAIGVAVAGLVIAAMLVTRRGRSSASMAAPMNTAQATAPTLTSIPGRCPSCKAELHPGASFCPECGLKVA